MRWEQVKTCALDGNIYKKTEANNHSNCVYVNKIRIKRNVFMWFFCYVDGFWPMNFAIFEHSFDMETQFKCFISFGRFEWHHFPYVRHKQFTKTKFRFSKATGRNICLFSKVINMWVIWCETRESNLQEKRQHEYTC